MRQYFVGLCTQRTEFIKPGDFGDGLNAWEILHSSCCHVAKVTHRWRWNIA